MAERYDREYQGTPLFKNLAESGRFVEDSVQRAHVPELNTIIAVAPELHARSLRIRAALTSASMAIERINKELVEAGVAPIASLDTEAVTQSIQHAQELLGTADHPEEDKARQSANEIIERLQTDGARSFVVQTSRQETVGGPQGFPKQRHRVERLSLVEKDGVYDLAEYTWTAEMWRAIYKPQTTVMHTYFDSNMKMGAPVQSLAHGEAIFSQVKHGQLKNSSWRTVERKLKELEQGLQRQARIQPVRDFLQSQALEYRFDVISRNLLATARVVLANGNKVVLEAFTESSTEAPYGVRITTYDPYEFDRDLFVRFDWLTVHNEEYNSDDTSLLDELNDALLEMQHSDAAV